MNTEILSILNNDEPDLDNLTLYFEEGVELDFYNGVARIWKGTSYMGVSKSYFAELLEHDGIILNGKIYHYERYGL